jgi:transcriptional regulator with XRE-family HTH domain
MNMSGNRLKELRESLQLSVDEFAKALGIHRSSLYRYEGTNKSEPREIPIGLAIKISEIYGVSLDWLAGNSEVKFINQTSNKLTEIYEALSDSAKQELFDYAMYLKSKESGK